MHYDQNCGNARDTSNLPSVSAGNSCHRRQPFVGYLISIFQRGIAGDQVRSGLDRWMVTAIVYWQREFSWRARL